MCFIDRAHLVDCLPRTWMLDGLVVTSNSFFKIEKAQLKNFIILFHLYFSR